MKKNIIVCRSRQLSKDVKKGKGFKVSLLNKLLTRLSALLAQIKAGSN